MRLTWLFTVVLVIFLSLSFITSEGSVIIQQLNSPDDLDFSGNIIYAVNFGNNGNPTVGGVVFAQEEVHPQITHALFYESAISNWGYGGTPPETGDVGLNQLLDGMAYRGTIPSQMSVDIGGLTIGQTYLLQTFGYEPYESNHVFNISVEGTPIATGYNTLTNQGGVVGQGGSVLKYEFVATDSTLNIDYQAPSSRVGFGGFILAEIPEPATISLLAFGTIALLRKKS